MASKAAKSPSPRSNKAQDKKPGGRNTLKRLNVSGKDIQLVYLVPDKATELENTADEWKEHNWFMPAQVLRTVGDLYVVKVPSGETCKLPSDCTQFVTTQDQEGVDDILKLDAFSEMSLIHTLRVRYEQDEVYTFVGPILISINPYKRMPELYTVEVMLDYRGKKATERSPHLFLVADAAYTALMASAGARKSRNQSIIISGESGAGKTEATKIIMQFLARITSVASGDQTGSSKRDVGQLEQRVLNANPLLEAFGNARTLRNDNSSRFGKFIRIEFDNSGRIVGASIINYLLEKTRIVHQLDGERNFHIFYQLLRGGQHDFVESFGIPQRIEDYQYLSQLCTSIEGVSDEDEFTRTRECMRSISIDDPVQNVIFGLVAAVLVLGNVQFEKHPTEDHVKGISPSTVSHFSTTARLLGVSDANLQKSMCMKTMNVGGNLIVRNQELHQAFDKRDSLCKAIYSALFVWLVERLNRTISTTQRPWGFIGVLDIYGFENFQTNGFEQLLINYANEMLQNHFNKHIFSIEQKEYEAENIDWTYITFNDNQTTVDLIDAKPNNKSGIFQTLDDAFINQRSGDANVKFLNQLNTSWAEHPNFVIPRFGSNQRFGILHYAGEVYYNVEGFSEKNRDSLDNDMRDLIRSSSSRLFNELFQELPETVASPSNTSRISLTRAESKSSSGKLRETTICQQFKTSLKSLYETLDSTEPRYVRCIKPNHFKLPDAMNALEVLRQLRYAGMMETIRIRQQGYALRQLHDDFYNRYIQLAPSSSTLQELVDTLSRQLKVSKESWQVGLTRIFLKRDLSYKLDTMLLLRMQSGARTVQRYWKHYVKVKMAVRLSAFIRCRLAVKKWKRFRRAVVKLQALWRRIRQFKSYQKTKYGALHLHAIVRGFIGRRIARKLANPYVRMTYEQLSEAMKKTNEELSIAVAQKNFQKCEELQRMLEDMNMAKAAMPRPVRVPRNRREVETEMVEVQLELQHALSVKDFSNCSALQERTKELEEWRLKFPALAEVTKDIELCRQQMEHAMNRKDFRACGELQDKLAHLETTAATLQSDPQNMSAESVRKRKQDLEQSIQKAMTEKQFQLCGDLQAQLEKIEAIASTFDVPPETLRQRLVDMHIAFAELRKAKEWQKCAELQMQIYDFENLVKDLPPEPTLSRADVLQKLTTLKQDLESAMKSRNFAECARLNEQIAKYETTLDSMPSPQVLKQKITQLEVQLSEAMKTRNFAECAHINAELDRLKPEFERIKAEMPEEEKSTAVEPSATITAPSNETTLDQPSKVTASDQKISSSSQSTPAASKAKPTLAAKSAQGKAKPITETQSTPRRPSATTVMPSSQQSKSDSRHPVVPVMGKSTPPRRPSVQAPASTPVLQKAGSLSGAKPVVPRQLSTLPAATDERPVSRLRPRTPIILQDDATVSDVCVEMTKERTDAALLVNADGALQGIITDNDITRRVVSKGLNPDETLVNEVMTKNPTCVKMRDSALDALQRMIENHFRHLPVLDADGVVVGLLDIAKCLYDAISRIEKLQKKAEAGQNPQLTTTLMELTGNGLNKQQAAAMQALFGPLMEQTFGSSIPSLRDVVPDEKVILAVNDTVRHASMEMATARKAALICSEGSVVGIITPKDIMSRVVAKGLNPDTTLLEEVMTPNPDIVPCDMTILDALHQMHDHKYLNLPVVDNDGTVMGIVDVMDIMSGGGESASASWRAFFGDTMADDDDSDTASVRSGRQSISSRTKVASQRGKAAAPSIPAKSSERPVSRLNPKAPLTLPHTATVLEVAENMSQARADAALIVNEAGSLLGIITDNDITRRAVAKSLDLTRTVVSKVMTKNPTCVASDDSALDALETMVRNKFRHLPVLDKDGVIVGLLDIAKCLYDAISRLEKVQRNDDLSVPSQLSGVQMRQLLNSQNKIQASAMQALLATMFGSSMPTLRDVLNSHGECVIVSLRDTVRQVAQEMARTKKSALVLERKVLLGILTPKDILNRVVAAGLDPDDTDVNAVMTPNPDTALPDATLLDALHQMHDHRYLNLPIVEESGRVSGLVDIVEIMDTIGGEGGSGWRSFFSSAMDEDNVEISSQGSGSTRRNSVKLTAPSPSPQQTDRPVSRLRPKIPIILEEDASVQEVAEAMSNERSDSCLLVSSEGGLLGIITDHDLARRVVAQFLDPHDTLAKKVMTKNPTCVKMEDSALDALQTMLENRFRHLPVLDKDGVVVGVLDIAKCLYDAISRIERMQENENSAAGAANVKDAVKQLSGSGTMTRNQQIAMQSLLGPMLEQMFGSSVPTLGSILGNAHDLATVTPTSNVREATTVMARARKAVLVIDQEDTLVGILTPKDVMNRVISKNLNPDVTSVESVMTPNPDFVSPSMTLLDALHQMHDHKYLHLPVVEPDGTVVGLLDVIEIMCGAGGSGGWRSFFSNAIGGDDESDTASVKSGRRSIRLQTKSNIVSANPIQPPTELVQGPPDRPVSKLRPKLPTVLSDDVSVQEVAEAMAKERVDAALIVSTRGGLQGIITDNDLTRRVVAKFLDPTTTSVAKVMTRSPTCVKMEDSALDALQTMLENKFRHLPVLDRDGTVVGVLDIAKCLYDAISRIEHAQENSSSEVGGSVKVTEALQSLNQKGLSKSQQKAMQAMLGPLMEQMFGSSVPTLRSLISHDDGFVTVSPTTNVREAAALMAQARKAALIVDDSELVGIFTPKDLLLRVLATGLNPDLTAVESVMTPNPDSVPPETSILDALHQMHDHKYLHLPVVEEDGTVVGLVDVIEIMCSAGGSGGWRAFFNSAMANDDSSETGSIRSATRRDTSIRESGSIRPASKVPSQTPSERPVSRLRPKKPVTCKDNENVQTVVELMAGDRSDAALLVDRKGALTGIITDNDLTRRLVACFLSPTETIVRQVMTKEPTCVTMEDSALDALQMMLENKFRHLPVLDKDGAVVGVIDIAKCLYDAISRIERAKETSEGADVNVAAAPLGDAMKNMTKQQQIAMQALLGPIMQQMFGSTTPTLRGVLAHAGEPVCVTPSTNVRECAAQMAQARKAALVLDGPDLVGILTPKDILNRVLARTLNPDLTAVESVMTPNPDFVPPDMTVLDALHQMHDHKYLHLPVVDEDGTVMGLVDVIEIMCGAGGSAGWRSFFNSTMTIRDDLSDSGSVRSRQSKRPSVRPSKVMTAPAASAATVGAVNRRASGVFVAGKPPRASRIVEDDDEGSDHFSISSEPQNAGKVGRPPASLDSTSYLDNPAALGSSISEEFVFKVADARGHTHRFTAASDQVHVVRSVVAQKMRCQPEDMVLVYLDEEQEEVVIDSNASLKDAVATARRGGNTYLKLRADIPSSNSKPGGATNTKGGLGNVLVLSGVGVGLAVAATVAILYLRRK